MKINKLNKKVLSFLLALAVMITILPVNAFAAGLSIYAKSSDVEAKISGNTVNINISRTLNDLVDKDFTDVGKEVKVTVTYYNGAKQLEVKKTLAGQNLSVTLDASSDNMYNIKIEPSYFANGETSYAFDYVMVEANGTSKTGKAPVISGNTIEGTVEVPSQPAGDVTATPIPSEDTSAGLTTLYETEKPLYVEKGQCYYITIQTGKAVKDVYFVAYTWSNPSSMQVMTSGLKNTSRTFGADKWYTTSDSETYALITWTNTNYKEGVIRADFIPSTSGYYGFACFSADSTVESGGSDTYELTNVSTKVTVKAPKITQIGASTPSSYNVSVSVGNDADAIEYKLYKKGSSKAVKSGTSYSSLISFNGLKHSLYTVKVRTYKTVSGKKYYSKWVSKKFLTVPEFKKEATKKTLRTNGVTLKWTKVTGATSYIVSYSSDGQHFKKLGTTKNCYYKVKRTMKSEQYFRIVAVTKANGKTIKSLPYDLKVSLWYY